MNIVCNFHAISDSIQFRKIINVIGKNFTFVDGEAIERFYNEEIQLKKACHITFDDGHRSFYEIVMDILEKKGIPCSLFVSPARILNEKNFWFQNYERVNKRTLSNVIRRKYGLKAEKINKFNLLDVLSVLRIEEIETLLRVAFNLAGEPEPEYVNITKEMLIEINKKDFIKIGAHTMNHPILANELSNDMEQEIIDSVTRLEKLINKEVTSFAYPNGRKNNDYGYRELKYLKNTPIKIAFTTNPDHLSLNDNRFEIPRIGLSLGNINKIQIKLKFPKQFERFKKFFKYNENENISRKKIRNLLNITNER